MPATVANQLMGNSELITNNNGEINANNGNSNYNTTVNK